MYHSWEGPAAGLARMLYEIGWIGKGWRPLRDRALPMVLETELQKVLASVSNVTLASMAQSGVSGPLAEAGLWMVGSWPRAQLLYKGSTAGHWQLMGQDPVCRVSRLFKRCVLAGY